MPSAFCCFAVRCNRYHGLDHDVRIDTAIGQSHLPAAKLLEIELPQAFRPSEVALRIMRDAVSGEKITEVEPEAGLCIMRVTILEAFDVAKRLRFVKTIFELHQANPDRRKIRTGRSLSCGPYGNAASGQSSCRDDEDDQLVSTHCDDHRRTKLQRASWRSLPTDGEAVRFLGGPTIPQP